MRRLRRAAGMTLLEVLLASAMLAMFFIAVFGIVFSTISTRQAIEEKAVPFAVGPVVLDRIVQDLLYLHVDSLDTSKDFFKGIGEPEEETRLDFVTSVPSRDRLQVKDEFVRAATNEVGLRLRRSETERDTFSLYRREDLGVDDDPTEGGKYYKLCDRVRRFTISYFEEDPGEPTGDAAEGLKDWDARQEGKLPWGVRVTLVLASTDVDEDGETIARDYTFETFVPFRTRFDKPDGAPKQPGR